MSKFLLLNGLAGTEFQPDQVNETNGEDDQEDEVIRGGQVEKFIPTAVNTANIRSFHPRKPERNGTERVGTRIVFNNKTALPVRETMDVILRMIGEEDVAHQDHRQLG
jgi:hypothetical protein